VEAGEVGERRGEAEAGARGRSGRGEGGDNGLEEGDGAVEVAGVDQVVHLVGPAGGVHRFG
jgi:hypothetical protein